MRTTLDLPDELLREAKIAAINRGVTLRDLVAGALERDLHGGGSPVARGRRLDFPLRKRDGAEPLNTDKRLLDALELESDLRGTGIEI